MKYALLFICVFVLLRCDIHEGSTGHTATLFNDSQHQITVLFYKNGLVPSADTIKLASGQKMEICNNVDRGLDTARAFYSSYFGNADDSARVIFEKVNVITHYMNTPKSLNVKYYMYNSNRNLFNYFSYSFTSSYSSKYSIENMHLYTFTEQDYLDAK